MGKIPIAPGTIGSFVALIAWYYFGSNLSVSYFLFLIGLVFIVGVISSNLTEKHLEHRDPGVIVIDEWVGQWIALIAIKASILYGMVAFILFRIFDIWKPYPVNKFEGISNGWGVMLDDVVAGIYSFIFIHILISLGL